MTEKNVNRDDTVANEAQIAVLWQEEGYLKPPQSFIDQANMKDANIRERFGEKHFPECYREYADMLTWFKPYDQVLDTSNPPFWKWFTGGKINVCYNCVDRHLEKYRNKAAFIFVSEVEDEPPVAMTYQELYVRVNEMAALLQDYCGLRAGDRVTLHLPMTLDLPITMLACARLGIIHSQVFGGFSGKSAGQRIQDSGSRYLITCDAYWRSGHLIDHKEKADIAVQEAADLHRQVAAPDVAIRRGEGTADIMLIEAAQPLAVVPVGGRSGLCKNCDRDRHRGRDRQKSQRAQHRGPPAQRM